MNYKPILYAVGAIMVLGFVFASVEYRVTVNDQTDAYLKEQAASSGKAPGEGIGEIIDIAIAEKIIADKKIIDSQKSSNITRMYQRCQVLPQCKEDLYKWLSAYDFKAAIEAK